MPTGNVYYLMYGRPRNSGKKFKALDLKNGVPVSRLMYATIFDDEEAVNGALKSLIRDNPEWEFRTRKFDFNSSKLRVT